MLKKILLFTATLALFPSCNKPKIISDIDLNTAPINTMNRSVLKTDSELPALKTGISVEAQTVSLPEFAISIDNDKVFDDASNNALQLTLDIYAEITPHSYDLPIEQIIEFIGEESGDGTIPIAKKSINLSKDNKRTIIDLQLSKQLYDLIPASEFEGVIVYVQINAGKKAYVICDDLIQGETLKSLAGTEQHLTECEFNP